MFETTRPYRSLWMLLIGLALAVTGLVTTIDQAHGSDVPPPPRAHWMKAPCHEEDSVNCTWNAQVLGDGIGHSFYSVKRDGIRCTFYVKTKDAKRWDKCEVVKATPASPGSRPIPGVPLEDVCDNIDGKQTIVDIASRRYDFVGDTADHQCKKGPLF